MLNRDTTHRSPNSLSIVSLAVLIFVVPLTATAECPTNTVSCVGTSANGEVEFYAYEESTDPTNGVSVNRSSATYDLVRGKLSAIVNVDDVHRHRSRVIAVDRFQLHGVPEAVLTARLNLSLIWIADPSGRMAWAGGDAELRVGIQTVTAESFHSGIDRSIEIEFTAIAGQPFDVLYATSAVGWGYYPSAEMYCRLEFIGIPEGAEITSCNGYGSSSVPTDRTTWGKVKALYR